MQNTLAVPAKCSVSQEQVHSSRAGTGGCLRAEIEDCEFYILPPELRDWAGPEKRPVSKKEVLCYRGSSQTKIPASRLLESSIFIGAELGLKGGLQKCSAHGKVCEVLAKALSERKQIWRGSGLCYKNLGELTTELEVLKLMLRGWWGEQGRGNPIEIVNLSWMTVFKKTLYVCGFLVDCWKNFYKEVLQKLDSSHDLGMSHDHWHL